MQVPMKDRRKLFRKTYYISVSTLAHILERHYYKILRMNNAVAGIHPLGTSGIYNTSMPPAVKMLRCS